MNNNRDNFFNSLGDLELESGSHAQHHEEEEAIQVLDQALLDDEMRDRQADIEQSDRDLTEVQIQPK